ncbi:hypothetical protein AGMMS4956_21500 [Bacteroidia bacterium]|nr:hypothetical protein AGMMS4956_21500 [Bacteroidia bacterium]
MAKNILEAPVFISPADYFTWKGEVTDKEDLVDLAGYMSPEDQLLMFQKAGKNLTAWAAKIREEGFDYGPDDDTEDEQFDPTRESNYDLVDAALDLEQTQKDIKAAQVEFASRKPQAASEVPPDSSGKAKDDKGLSKASETPPGGAEKAPADI